MDGAAEVKNSIKNRDSSRQITRFHAAAVEPAPNGAGATKRQGNENGELAEKADQSGAVGAKVVEVQGIDNHEHAHTDKERGKPIRRSFQRSQPECDSDGRENKQRSEHQPFPIGRRAAGEYADARDQQHPEDGE
jgi:hypothetical protein